jgi:oligoendopeptidase F
LLNANAIDFEFRDDKRRWAWIYLRPLTWTPLMMLNISASIDWVEQAAHELWHVVHFWLVSAYQNYLLSDVWSEVSELFSHSFELFALEEMRHFMSEKNYKNYYDYYFINFFDELRRSCMYELFHIKAYINNNLNAKTLAEDWLEIIWYADEWMIDRSIAPQWKKYYRQHHWHTFRYEFYTIHYIVWMVWALQLLSQYRENKSATLQLITEVMKKWSTISSKETFDMLWIDLFGDVELS